MFSYSETAESEKHCKHIMCVEHAGFAFKSAEITEYYRNLAPIDLI